MIVVLTGGMFCGIGLFVFLDLCLCVQGLICGYFVVGFTGCVSFCVTWYLIVI